MGSASISRHEARLALAVLFGINFLNYIDRYVSAAVAALIQKDFSLGDVQVGLIGSMFMAAYMVASPVAGLMADRWPRRYFVGGGVLVWSVATVLSGLASGYRMLLTARAFIGVGEAGFGGVAPTLICDLFSKERRGRMLSFFYVAIPVGTALGYLLGGWIGPLYGWRRAFFVAGAPGILLGLMALRMKEPVRGAGDGVVRAEHTFELKSFTDLARNQTFFYTTLGMSAMTFALGGMAYWFPTFLYRVKGMPLDRANDIFGLMTVCAGLLGTFLGGWLGDFFLKRTPRSYLLVSGIGMLVGTPAIYLGLTATEPRVYLPALFVGEVLVLLNTGPANAVLVNICLPEIRATAIASAIFVYHLLGDVPSPILIGKVSDATGSLGVALQLTAVAMAVSGLLFLWGARSLGEDSDRVAEILARREAGA